MKNIEFKTRKALVNYAKAMGAIDLTNNNDYIKGLQVVGKTFGIYGTNGALLVNEEGQYYYIAQRSTSLFYYL